MAQIQQQSGHREFTDPQLGQITADLKKTGSGLVEHYETMKDYLHQSVDIADGEFKAFNAKLWEILTPAEQAKAKELAEKVRSAVRTHDSGVH